MTVADPIGGYVEQTLRLLELERQAELDETMRLHSTLPTAELERRGLCLRRLDIVDETSGLGGRALWSFAPIDGSRLPATRLGTGDIVAIRFGKGSSVDAAPTGVVSRKTPHRLTVALDDVPDVEMRPPYQLNRLVPDVTFRRIRQALERLRKGGGHKPLRQVLFGLREPVFEELKPLAEPGEHLNDSQVAAIQFALAAEHVALLHGPPGTGKSTTLVELIRRAVARKERVLACAPSNVAVDNLVERLVESDLNVVRLGHPARLLPTVLEHSLDHLVSVGEGAKIATDLRRDLARSQKKLRKTQNYGERRGFRDEIRQLRSELQELEKRRVQQVVLGADVVLTTNTGAADGILRDHEFDLLVIDEAAQALEPSCWIPLLKAKRVVLAGDHHQLSPTVVSRQAEKEGFSRTLFDRLAAIDDGALCRMLQVQYRMHEQIMVWSSQTFYEGRLTAHSSVAAHRLCDLDGVETTDETQSPVFFVDTAGCDLEESVEVDGDSKFNTGEAEIVNEHVRRLLAAGVPTSKVAVITPYNAQVECLRRLLADCGEALEVDSVDGFQGREKEAVVISMVRSNTRGEVGFLADQRRLNVAATRARRHLAVIGDSATLTQSRALTGFFDYLSDVSEYRSAWEYR